MNCFPRELFDWFEKYASGLKFSISRTHWPGVTEEVLHHKYLTDHGDQNDTGFGEAPPKYGLIQILGSLTTSGFTKTVMRLEIVDDGQFFVDF